MRAFLRILVIMAIFTATAYSQTTLDPVAESIAAETSVAAKPPVLPIPPAKADSSLDISLLRMMGGFGLVICLMIGGYFAARKFAPRFFSRGISEKNLRLIETLSMGDKRSISMIEFGRSRFLVGNTPQQISLLATLSESVSLVSEPETVPESTKRNSKRESALPFRNLYETEKKRPTPYAGNPLPDDIRVKMRQLREALER